MANMTITTPGGSTTFDIPANHAVTLLEMAEAHMDGTPTTAQKEEWLRRYFFILMRDAVRNWKRDKLKADAASAYTAMPLNEV